MPNLLDLEIDAARLSTPKDQCRCIKSFEVQFLELADLEAKSYDYAPVLHSDRVAGLIRTVRLRELMSQSKQMVMDDLFSPVGLPRQTTIGRVVEAVVANPVVLIYEDESGAKESAIVSWRGLVTASDLNKQYFRSKVYELLAELEMGLLNVIKLGGLDHNSWLKALTLDAQARVLGYWELAKRRDVDTNPLTACMFPDLLKIAASDKYVLNELGFSSRNQFNDRVGGLPDLRNMVMHPIRPLILCREDVVTLQRRLKTAWELTNRILDIVASPTPLVFREATAPASEGAPKD